MKTIKYCLSLILVLTTLWATASTEPNDAQFEIFKDLNGYKINITVNKAQLRKSVESYCHSKNIKLHGNQWEVYTSTYLNKHLHLVADDVRTKIKVFGSMQFGENMHISAGLVGIYDGVSEIEVFNNCFTEEPTGHTNEVRIKLNNERHTFFLWSGNPRATVNYKKGDLARN